MGGGHLTRPQMGGSTADPNHPLTEFYNLLMKGIEQTGRFALPPVWALLDLPEGEHVTREEAAQYLHVSPRKRSGFCPALPEATFLVNSQHLCVDPQGRPTGLLLSSMGNGGSCCVRLSAPFGEEALGPMPEAATQVVLALTMQHIALADADPDALGNVLAESPADKQLVADPRLYNWTLKALSAARRAR